MKEVVGDLWGYASDNNVDAVCVFTNMTVMNGRLVMGKGQALQARKRFPQLPFAWGTIYTDRQRDGLDITLAVANNLLGYHLVSFPTKRHPSDASDLTLIAQSTQELVDAASMRDWQSVLLGRPGCGLGGLRWKDVRRVVAPILRDDRFVVITNE